MLKNMLSAVSTMIKDTKEAEVKCAKVILDEIIKSLEIEEKPFFVAPERAKEILEDPKAPEKPGKDVPFGGVDEAEKIEVKADGGKLTWIKYEDGSELAPEKEVLLNGNKMQYADAKGKAFQSLNVE